jgi:hypothetical protein
MKTWQYLVDSCQLNELEKKLNDNGLGGWELVAMAAHRDDPNLFWAVFKKPSEQ